MNEVINTISKHRSVRKFKNIPLTKEQIGAIVHSAQMASTSGNFQCFSIIGVTDAHIKQKLAIQANSSAISQCSYLFVFCVDFYRMLASASDAQKEKMQENLSFTYFFQTGVTSAAIALQNANLTAESLELGTVVLGGVGTVTELDEWLDLPENVIPLVGLAVGIPDEWPEQKPRLPQNAVFFENKYDHHLKDYVENYDKQMERYYQARTTNQQVTDWSQKNIGMLTQEIPFEFYSKYVKRKGFLLK